MLSDISYIYILFLASVHGFVHETNDFLLYTNLFIHQVLCTLIYRRRSLYSFLSGTHCITVRTGYMQTSMVLMNEMCTKTDIINMHVARPLTKSPANYKQSMAARKEGFPVCSQFNNVILHARYWPNWILSYGFHTGRNTQCIPYAVTCLSNLEATKMRYENLSKAQPKLMGYQCCNRSFYAS